LKNGPKRSADALQIGSRNKKIGTLISEYHALLVFTITKQFFGQKLNCGASAAKSVW
jgi:hypothetical protein